MDEERIAPNLYGSVPPSLVRCYSNRFELPVGGASMPLHDTVVLMTDITESTTLINSFANGHLSSFQNFIQCLNSCFATQIKIIEQFGGECITIAGDALIVIFRADPTLENMNFSWAMLHAVHCAVALQAKFKTFNPNGIQFNLHFAIGCGDMIEVHLGGHKNMFEYFLTGSPFDQLQKLLDVSSSNDILLSKEAWKIAKDLCYCSLLNKNGFHYARMDKLGIKLKHFNFKKNQMQTLHSNGKCSSKGYGGVSNVKFYSGLPYEPRFEVNFEEASNKYCDASIVFVQLTGLNLAVNKVDIASLNDVFMSLQRCFCKHNGYCRQFLVDDKGTVLIIVFGLFQPNQQNSSIESLECSVDMRSILEQYNIAASFGIGTGNVFAGLLGTQRRHEYIVIGPAVIRASKLSREKHENYSILCDNKTFCETRSETSRHIKFTYAGKIKPKTNTGALKPENKFFVGSRDSFEGIENGDLGGTSYMKNEKGRRELLMRPFKGGIFDQEISRSWKKKFVESWNSVLPGQA